MHMYTNVYILHTCIYTQMPKSDLHIYERIYAILTFGLTAKSSCRKSLFSDIVVRIYLPIHVHTYIHTKIYIGTMNRYEERRKKA